MGLSCISLSTFFRHQRVCIVPIMWIVLVIKFLQILQISNRYFDIDAQY
jgi:hypothetical protein